MPDATSPEPLPTRRKRMPLARAVQSLKRRLKLYRTLAVVAAVALVGSGAYAVVEATEAPAPVLLGTGRAGVATASDASAAPEPTPPAETPVPEAPAPEAPPATEAPGEALGSGDASYYGDELAGNPTASGERFDPAKFTAAHRTLPLGSRVRVTNTRNGESVIVRINDRGPFHGQRVIDLSKAAAREIGMLARGTARVRLELLARM